MYGNKHMCLSFLMDINTSIKKQQATQTVVTKII